MRFFAPDQVIDSVRFINNQVYHHVPDCQIVPFISIQVDIQDAIVLSKFTCSCDQFTNCVGLLGLVI